MHFHTLTDSLDWFIMGFDLILGYDLGLIVMGARDKCCLICDAYTFNFPVTKVVGMGLWFYLLAFDDPKD